MSKVIKTLLRDRGITLSVLAEELGVNPSTVSLVVSGRNKSYPIQQAIANRLETTIENLWPGQVRLRRNRAEIAQAHASR